MEIILRNNANFYFSIMIYTYVIMYIFYSFGCAMASENLSPGTETFIFYNPESMVLSIIVEWIYHLISIAFVMCVMIALDSIPILFFIQIASRYQCMILLLELLNKDDNTKRDHNDDTRVLRTIYFLHSDTLRIARETSNSYFAPGLVHFMFGSFINVFTLYVLRTGLASVAAIIVCLGSAFQFVYICYLGNDVLEKSYILTEKFYFTNWYRMSWKNRTNLIIMMSMSQNEIAISIGSLVTVCYFLFVQILKSTYSYCAILMALDV